jgi:hypothetical protein
MWTVFARYAIPARASGEISGTFEHVVALCATKELAIQFITERMGHDDGSDCTPRWEQAGYFIRENPYIQVIGLSK